MADWKDYAHVTSRLRKLQRGKTWWRALCPVHQTGNKHTSRTLALRIGDKGSLILECHRGCSFEQIATAMGLTVKDFCHTEHTPTDPHSTKQRHVRKPQPTSRREEPRMSQQVKAEYIYTDEQGKPLFKVLRYDPKDFRQMRYVGGPVEESGSWSWGLGDTRRVLYRLPELVATPKSRRVVIVEGERDVETLRAHDIVATCNPMGAGKWSEDYNQYFTGRHVLIIPDADEPGDLHADAIAKSLFKVAASIKVVVPTMLTDGQDITDYLAKYSMQDFGQMVTTTDFFKAPAGGSSRAAKSDTHTADNKAAEAPATATHTPASEPAKGASGGNGEAVAGPGKLPFEARSAAKKCAHAMFARAETLEPTAWLVACRHLLSRYEQRLGEEIIQQKAS